LPPTCVATPTTGGPAPCVPPSRTPGLHQPQLELELPQESLQPSKQPLHRLDGDPSLSPLLLLPHLPLDFLPPDGCTMAPTEVARLKSGLSSAGTPVFQQPLPQPDWPPTGGTKPTRTPFSLLPHLSPSEMDLHRDSFRPIGRGDPVAGPRPTHGQDPGSSSAKTPGLHQPGAQSVSPLDLPLPSNGTPDQPLPQSFCLCPCPNLSCLRTVFGLATHWPTLMPRFCDSPCHNMICLRTVLYPWAQ